MIPQTRLRWAENRRHWMSLVWSICLSMLLFLSAQNTSPQESIWPTARNLVHPIVRWRSWSTGSTWQSQLWSRHTMYGTIAGMDSTETTESMGASLCSIWLGFSCWGIYTKTISQMQRISAGYTSETINKHRERVSQNSS